MADLLKRTYPVPAGSIICCGQCNAEIWKAKRDITVNTPIGDDVYEAHIRPAPQVGDALVCPGCRTSIPDSAGRIYWKTPKR